MSATHVVVVTDDPVQLRQMAGILLGAGHEVSSFLEEHRVEEEVAQQLLVLAALATEQPVDESELAQPEPLHDLAGSLAEFAAPARPDEEVLDRTLPTRLVPFAEEGVHAGQRPHVLDQRIGQCRLEEMEDEVVEVGGGAR